MPTYHIELFEGRTVEQKRKLVEEVTRVTAEVLGSAPSPWTSSSPTSSAKTGPRAASSGPSKPDLSSAHHLPGENPCPLTTLK